MQADSSSSYTVSVSPCYYIMKGSGAFLHMNQKVCLEHELIDVATAGHDLPAVPGQ